MCVIERRTFPNYSYVDLLLCYKAQKALILASWTTTMQVMKLKSRNSSRHNLLMKIEQLQIQ